MKLSEKATTELREILTRDFGEKIGGFSDEDLHILGTKLLELTALVAKRKMNEYTNGTKT